MHYMWYSRVQELSLSAAEWFNIISDFARAFQEIYHHHHHQLCASDVMTLFRLSDTLRPICCLSVSFEGPYSDFVLFAEVHSAPPMYSAYGPVRVLCSVKMVALQRAYSVAFIFVYTMQQLSNSRLTEYNTKAQSQGCSYTFWST
jgi:hypothetical protein